MKFFSLFYRGSLHRPQEQKVLSSEEYGVLIDSKKLLDEVKRDIEERQKELERQCEEVRAKAQKEGFDEGLSTFNQHIVYLDNQLKELRHEVMHKILPIALKAAQKVVAGELKMHPERIVDIVMQALVPATQSKHVTIYVHKGDKAILEQNKPRMKEIFERIELFAIQEREDIEPGSCMIKTDTGIINASMENQWRALEAAFEKYNK